MSATVISPQFWVGDEVVVRSLLNGPQARVVCVMFSSIGLTYSVAWVAFGGNVVSMTVGESDLERNGTIAGQKVTVTVGLAGEMR